MPWRLLVLFLAAVPQPACLQLPDYDETGCGDSILGAGEDCDGRYAIDGATCGAPGDEHACHYVCTSDAVCPDGWGCGVDGRCYQPQLVLAPPPAPKPLPMRVSDVTDVDGDGLGDLVGSTGVTISTRFGDVAGALDESFDLVIPPPSGKIWFAPLDGDAQGDAIIPLGATLVVLSGQETRDFASRLFPTLRLPLAVQEAAGVALEGDRDLQDPAREPLDLDSELLLLSQTESQEGPQSAMTFVNSTCGEVPVPLPDGQQVADLGGRPSAQNSLASGTRIPRADLDDDGFTEFALAFRGSPTLHLYGSAGSPVSPDPASCLRPVPYPRTPLISMPAGYVLGDQNALFVDIDGDTDLDVLVGITVSEPPGTPPAAIAVARALGDGTYEAEATPLVDLTRFPEEQRLLAVPLAAGDLDGDGSPEYVTPGGILQIGPDLQATPVILALPSAGSWVAAEVLDVNDDGALDVVAASSGSIDWFLNATPIGLQGQLNRFILDTVSLSPQLRSGDFNGDLLPDVALAGRIDENQNELTVVFSTSTGVPSEAQSIGRFGDRFHFMDTAFTPALGTENIDGVTDVMLWTTNDSLDPMRPPEAAFYAVQGSTSQRLLSPFFVVGDPRQGLQLSSVLIAAAGAFAGEAFGAPGNPRGIAVVSRSVAVSDPDTDMSGLTLLVPRNFGELRPTQPDPAPLVPLSSFHVDCALWLVGDVEQGDDFGPDELIGVEQDVFCKDFPSRPALAILVMSMPAPDMPPTLAIIDLPDQYDRATSARLVDVDANQSLDLVLVLGKKDASQADVMILWNDEGCPTSRFCESSATLLPSSPSLVPTDVVAMQLHGDARRELVVLSDSLEDGSVRSDLVEVFTVADDDRIYESTAAPLSTPPNRRITYLAAGDVNGDGLEDLVLGGDVLADVLIQTPAEPLGTTLTRQPAAREETP